MLRGYIDESYDGSGGVPEIFSLSCVVSDDSMWVWFELAWVDVLDRKNAQLEAEGRRRISRFHAADCSNSQGEFRGWSANEKKELCCKILDVFRRHTVHIYGYTMPLQLLVREIPKTNPNPVGFAYVILLTMLMDEIGKRTLELYPSDVISLHHDRCDYEAPLAEQFGHMISDPGFDYRDRFASIGPTCWQRCVRLQAADLIVYENFKEALRHQPDHKRKRRRSLELLLDLPSIGAIARGFDRKSIRELKAYVDRLGPNARQTILKTARIPA